MEFNLIHNNYNSYYRELGYKYILKETGINRYPEGIYFYLISALKFLDLETAKNTIFGATFAIFRVSLRLMSTYCSREECLVYRLS